MNVTKTRSTLAGLVAASPADRLAVSREGAPLWGGPPAFRPVFML